MPTLPPVDVRVLQEVNRFRFLTAGQLNRLMWPNNTRDRNRYAQLRLHRLAEHDFVLPLRDLPRPSTGSCPRVYTLGWRGRQYLRAQGDSVPSYYRPSELTDAPRLAAFMPHTLAVIDVLIAAQLLTETKNVPVRLETLLLDRDLRRLSLKVTVPAPSDWLPSRRVTVVPDALFTLSTGRTQQHFILEVDRNTERQQQWRRKVAALTCWLDSPASDALLPGNDLAILVVTPTPQRCDQLRIWTAAELHARGLFTGHGDLFAFSPASPVTLSPLAFFTKAHWYPAGSGPPDVLIDLSQ